MQAPTPQLTIYDPNPLLRGPVQVLRAMVRDLIISRELAWQLASRDIRGQYRQAALGLLWPVILPAATAAVWLFMHRSGVIVIPGAGMNYAAFAFSGTMLWSIFMDAVNAPLQQSIAARQILSKISFPREALILSGVYQVVFNGAIRLVIVGIVMWALQLNLDWRILLAPFASLSLILLGTAVGIFLTPLGLLYTDIGRALPLLMQFLMFISPVVYPPPPEGVAAIVLQWNPLTPLLLTCRALMSAQPHDSLLGFWLVTGAAVGLMVVALIIYRIAMPALIERMSN